MISTSVLMTIGGVIALDLLRKEIPQYLGSILYAGLLIFGLSGGLFYYAIWNLRSKQPHKIKTSLFYAFAIVFFGGIVFVYYLAFNLLLPPLTPSAATQYQWDQGPWLCFGEDPMTEMIIRWETHEPAPTIIEYGKNIVTTQQSIGDSGRRHVIHLTQLEPGTKYYYRLQNFTDSSWHNFTTAPDTTEPFTFLVLGDTRNSGGSDNSVNTKHGEVVDAMLTQSHNFTLNTGDVNYDGADLESWHVYFEDMQRDAADHPYMISAGNHELGGDGGKNFDYFFEFSYADKNPSLFTQGRYYSFNYSNAHFLIIDTFSLREITYTQLAFIENDLAKNQGHKWLFVLFHEPPLSTGDFNMNWYLINTFCPMFDKYGVDIVLTGHDHHYEAFNWTYGANGLTVAPNHDWNHNNVMYFVTGGGGSNLDMGITTRPPNTYTRRWYNNSAGRYVEFQEQSEHWLTNQTTLAGTYYHNSSEHAVQTELYGQIYGELAYHYMKIQVNDTQVIIETFYRNNTLLPGQRFILTKSFNQFDDGRRLYNSQGDILYIINIYAMAFGFNLLFIFGLASLDYLLRKKLFPVKKVVK
ncbi:MAG: purple acid phosphatase family protein [Candidatus Helarchaeota archaeon]